MDILRSPVRVRQPGLLPSPPSYRSGLTDAFLRRLVAEPVSWEAMADWYDEKQGDGGDLWHRSLIDPPFLARVGEVNGRDLLDLGCGNGYLARHFQRQGARVTAVDAAEGMIRVARAREDRQPLGVRYLVREASRLEGMEDGRFDLVYSNMALMDIEEAAGAIREVARVLRSYGRFVASLTHPCFGSDRGADWVWESEGPGPRVARRVFRYREPMDDPVEWNGPGDRRVATKGYHRPLSWYADRFREAGLAVTALDEPNPGPEFVSNSRLGEAIAAIPVHLVIEAVRWPRAAAAVRAV